MEAITVGRSYSISWPCMHLGIDELPNRSSYRANTTSPNKTLQQRWREGFKGTRTLRHYSGLIVLIV